MEIIKMKNNYLKIADHYQQCFEKHGDTPKGLDWDNQENLDKRYEVMLELLPNGDRDFYPTLLDFGCGYGGFFNYIKENHNNHISYTGIDINENTINKAKELYPEVDFKLKDINSKIDENNIGIFDYVICNGVFTVRRGLTQDEMSKFLCDTLDKLWFRCDKGIAFNLMSTLVDWKRDDLYHVSMDQICQYLVDNFSRNFIIRNDYGLYEYTIYLYK